MASVAQSEVHRPLASVREERRRSVRSILSSAGTAATLTVSAVLLTGCQVDSFFDPSIIGKWEPTPTSVPILDRISVIEDDQGEMVEVSDVTPDDLIAESREYRIAPGDRLLITLYDFEDRQGGTELTRDVDLQGNVDLPQLGLVNLGSKTLPEAQEEISRSLSRLVIEPLVSIVPVAQRQQTFAVIGAVETPGPYFIPRPDYRLLEAVTASGRFSESIEEIFVIRHLALDDSMTMGATPPPAGGSKGTQTTSPTPGTAPADSKPKENLIDLIDELSKPGQPGEKAPAEPENPAASEPAQPDSAEPAPTPGKEPVEPKRSAPGVLAAPIDLVGSQPADSATLPGKGSQGNGEKGQEAAIQLVQPGDSQTPGVEMNTPSNEPTWVFVNGEWVMVKPQQRGAAGGSGHGNASPTTPAAAGEADGASSLVTQRVIRIPVKALLAGDARYNIVVRKGDTIRVPAPVAGLVYMTGQVQRPGPYSLPDVGKLTLLRALDSAGGLSAIAIPERCDITRIVGKDRQATIQLNLRAIAEQTEPDLYLKPDDRINVGTNFWALPLAVLRGGFRTNYGFGFVVDRNFGNDVFGPAPENRQF